MVEGSRVISKMKEKQPLRRFGVDDYLSSNLVGEYSNRTPLLNTFGRVNLICPICNISFTRKSCEVKGCLVNYCSRACAGFASRKQVKVECQICSAIFTVKKSAVGKITCCSNVCKSKAASIQLTNRNINDWESGFFQGGEKHGTAKINEKEAIAISMDKRTHSTIAKEYGITRANVSNLKRGVTWESLQVKK